MKYIFFTIALFVTLYNQKALIIEDGRDWSVKGIIVYHAQEQELNETKLLNLSQCESSFIWDAKGDHGHARGIFQYHKPTFERYSKMYGQKLDYYSSEDQAKLTAWVWKNHPKEMRAWTCYKG